uniref:Uncharacterized protein n=1 Tax=Proboscia inermis TaxID=420281 RepID=A0A7S0BVK2_9STRA|mmetsp:Transcript_11485/g.11569  ORF Transcript_11485/g.11569 Transcript_11485/m.11569 type:complete len:158 (+) Transcript_11485:1150-1623(+)
MINATTLAFNTVAKSGRSDSQYTFNYWAVCNNNRNTYLDTKEPNYFMGLTLYNSDPNDSNLVNHAGKKCSVNGNEPCYFLHADMLHESPPCIGIAHDPELRTGYGSVYWVVLHLILILTPFFLVDIIVTCLPQNEGSSCNSVGKCTKLPVVWICVRQ